MAKHRTAAQKRATARLVAWNRSKRRHKNPSSSPRKHAYKARRRNPSGVVVHRRRAVRRRNPSPFSSGGLFGELMNKDGLIMVSAVALTPTALEMAMKYVAPSSTGYTRIAIKAGIGLGLAWAIHKWLNKKGGLVVGLVSAGTAVAEVIRQVQGPTSTLVPTASGYRSLPYAPAVTRELSGYRPTVGMSGYRDTVKRAVAASLPNMNR